MQEGRKVSQARKKEGKEGKRKKTNKWIHVPTCLYFICYCHPKLYVMIYTAIYALMPFPHTPLSLALNVVTSRIWLQPSGHPIKLHMACTCHACSPGLCSCCHLCLGYHLSSYLSMLSKLTLILQSILLAWQSVTTWRHAFSMTQQQPPSVNVAFLSLALTHTANYLLSRKLSLLSEAHRTSVSGVIYITARNYFFTECDHIKPEHLA